VSKTPPKACQAFGAPLVMLPLRSFPADAANGRAVALQNRCPNSS
jgi:hypothetical protein